MNLDSLQPPRKPLSAETKHRNYKVAGAIAGVAIAALTVFPRSHNKTVPDSIKTADELNVCVPQGHQSFTFKAGEGEAAAVLAIKGTGDGPGDACWDEGVQSVEKALGRDQYGNVQLPQVGQTIDIPAAEAPVSK